MWCQRLAYVDRPGGIDCKPVVHRENVNPHDSLHNRPSHGSLGGEMHSARDQSGYCHANFVHRDTAHSEDPAHAYVRLYVHGSRYTFDPEWVL